MVRYNTVFSVVVGSLVLAVTMNPAVAQHAGDFLVGRTAAGQLAIQGPVATVIRLNPVSAVLSGWTAPNPGFDVPLVDTPALDFYRISSGASVWLEVVGIDTGMRIWQSGMTSVADAPGEKVYLGGFSLHKHLIWHIDSTVPAIGGTWDGLLAAQLRLIDQGSTHYAASEPYMMYFASRLRPIDPLNPQPADGQTVSLSTVTLFWNSGITDLGATYSVYLDTVNPPVQLIAVNLDTTSCGSGVLQPGRTYYWKVVAGNAYGQTIGPVWSFNTLIQGDINHDGYVNVGDLQLLVAAWGSSRGDGGAWNPDADINTEGFVNVGDLQLLVSHWSQSS